MSIYDPIPAPSLVKISQRASKSCTECIRRKNRCNKQLPCDVCLKRGVPHLCRLEALYQPVNAGVPTLPSLSSLSLPSDLLPFAQHVYGEIDGLRKRIGHLEGGHTGNKKRRIDARKTSASVGPVEHDDRDISDMSPAEAEDAATTLEFLALGLDRRLGAEPDCHGAPSRGPSPRRKALPQLPSTPSHILDKSPDRAFPDYIIEALLPRQHTDAILSFAEAHGLWQHCCLFFPTFWQEVDDFWIEIGKDSTWSKIEPTWVALLYSLLGIAVHQMSAEDANKCGLPEADRFVLPNAFVSAAEDALYHGQFMNRPTIWTVQAIVMLTLCGHNVCESDLLSSLLAVGIKTAQTLKLHTLGQTSKALEGSGVNIEVRARKIQELEMKKRLWWALAQEDWFGIPFRGVWSIHQDHFDTPMPFNCHDSDLAEGRYLNRPNMELTVAFKQRFSSQVSVIVRDVFYRLRHLGGRSPFNIAREAATNISSLLSALPAPLRSFNSPHPSHLTDPPWTNTMRHYIQISASHKIIIVHRAALARGGGGGTQEEKNASQAACVSAAESLVDELERGGRQEIAMQSLWTIPYHGLAAAVVLALDMAAAKSQSVIARRRQGVEKARLALERLSPTSRIARRGLQVIADLMKEVDPMAHSQIGDKSTAMARVVKLIKLPANEMISSNTSTEASNTPDVSLFLPEQHPIGMQVSALDSNPPNQQSLEYSTSNFQPQSSSGSDNPINNPSTWLSDGSLFTNAGAFANEVDTTHLLWALQQEVPDVGRLFDGSLGSFDWGLS